MGSGEHLTIGALVVVLVALLAAPFQGVGIDAGVIRAIGSEPLAGRLALELWIGTDDVDRWYADREGNAVTNFGVAVGHE